MNGHDRTAAEDDHHPIFCPYCGHEQKEDGAKVRIYIHPLKFQPDGGWCKRKFHRGILSNNILPKDNIEEECRCQNGICEEKFSILRDPDLLRKLHNKDELKTNEKFLLEEWIDASHKNIINIIIVFGLINIFLGLIEVYIGHPEGILGLSNQIWGLLILFSGILIIGFGILKKNDFGKTDDTTFSYWKKLLKNTILVAILWLTLIFLPALVTGSVEKFWNDKPIFITPILFIFLLTEFQRQVDTIRTKFIAILPVDPHTKKLNDVLPVKMHEAYKESGNYQILKNTSVKRFFFGKPYKNLRDRCTPPVIFGICGIIIGFVYFLYFLPPVYYYPQYAPFTFYEVITPQSNPLVYTSLPFNIGWLLFYLPFWITIGTVVWLCLIIPYFVAKISKNWPLNIDQLEEIGGPEIFGSILLNSNFSIVVLALGFIAYLIWNYQTPPFTTVFLMSLFPIAIFFGFFYPLYPIHLEMKERKSKEINELRKSIDYEKIKKGTLTHDEIHLNSLRLELINKISSKKVWPISFDVWVKVISVLLVSIFQIILNIKPLLESVAIFLKYIP